MGKTPFPHQFEGIKYGTSRKGGGFLYMKMRLGKTLVQINIIKKKRAYPCVVVCPATVLASWENELLEEGTNPEEILIFDDRLKGNCSKLSNHLANTTPKWILVNFEKVEIMDVLMYRIRHLLPSKVKQLKKKRKGPLPVHNLPNWKSFIIDESYRISNRDSNIVKYLLKYPKPEGQLRFCMSGAPSFSDPIALASQFFFVDGHFMGCSNLDEYIDKYYAWNRFSMKWELRNTRHLLKVKQYVNNNAYCLEMEDVGLGAKKLYSTRTIEPDQVQEDLLLWLSLTSTYEVEDEEREMYSIVRNTFEQKIAAGVHPLTDEIISETKINYVLGMLQDRKEERYLILSGCKPPIFRMAQRLEEAGYRVGVITGDTPMRERETIRRSFQAGELDHVVAQVVTVKMGLDFSSLDCILFLNNSNSPDARVQAEDRGQHTQRTTPYMIIDIAVRGFSCARRATALRRHKKLSSMMIKQMNKEVLQRVRKLNSLD
tara:strand:+ start:5263 stop:6720 length:1458 start_codon:yes stop_codon:yes gene_type:complete